jgi:TolB-like protein
MASIIPGYEYDIFISYRQKDNKHDGWVTKFVDNLKGELESTFKEEISVYFDINPHDGLLETHDVDASLKDKLKCLIFIPIISRTYCDPKSFAWENEFKAFVEQASQDQFGLKVKLPNGNVASRLLPVRINDLDISDIKLYESILGGVFRGVDFIYKEPGVDKPLAPEDDEKKNLNNTKYRIQIIKVAHAIKEIILGLKAEPVLSVKGGGQHKETNDEVNKEEKQIENEKPGKIDMLRWLARASILAVVIIAAVLAYPKIIKRDKEENLKSFKTVDKSVAVLPFANLSNDPEQEYFSDGMVDAILDHLFKIGDLKVISRTSSMRYKNTKLTLKEIARELGVSALLEGSVQKIGNNVRITAQLIDAKTDTHLWSETYDKDLSDVFSIQSEVAKNVAQELKATLTLKETQLIHNAPLTTNQLAYDFYLKGNDYYSKTKHFLALDMYSKAIQKDSLFTAAYALRAKIHLILYWEKVEGWESHGLLAKDDIKKGFQLNPELPEVKFAKAMAYYHLDRNYDNSLKIINELKKEAPNMADLYIWSSYILRRQGKFKESTIEAKQGIKMDPFNAEYMSNLIGTYNLLHQYDNQIEFSRKGLSLIPDYKGFSIHIFNAYMNKTGNLKTALKESGLKEADVQDKVYYYTRQYDKLLEFIPKDTSIVPTQFNYSPKTYLLARVYYLSNNKSACKIYADSAIYHLQENIKEDSYDDRFYATLGKCYAFIGNSNEAIKCGLKAVSLKPNKLDAYQGIIKEQDLMEIYIFTGNYDQALDKMEYLLSVPSNLSIGQLMIDPIFDNLRRLPRFQKIIDSAQKN